MDLHESRGVFKKKQLYPEMLGAFALSEKFFWMVILFEMVKLIEVLDNKYQERGFKNVDVRFLFFPGSNKTPSSLISQLQGAGCHDS